MPMPPNASPNVVLLMQRLDLIEKKIDWIAGRVASLTYGFPPRRPLSPSESSMIM